MAIRLLAMSERIEQIRPVTDTLESDHGYVDVDRRGTENTMSLSERGKAAAAGLITDDHRVVHPAQEMVFAAFDQPSRFKSQFWQRY